MVNRNIFLTAKSGWHVKTSMISRSFFVFFFSLLSLSFAADPKAKSFPQNTEVEHIIWDGNQISTVHGNHGDIVSRHITNTAGLEWPKGSGKTAVLQAGLWLASGKFRPIGSENWQEEIRTAAAMYRTEFLPGTIEGTINNGHIYQIHRTELKAFLENDYAAYSSMGAFIPHTVINGESIYTELVETSFPTTDFENWPVAAGAPWVDSNGDDIYNIRDGDHPDILGDVFHWYVMNDGDAGQHGNLWGTAPMNIEVQTSLFGFDQQNALGNVLFIRWVLINKGVDDLDSTYISIWHDDNVGDGHDDLVACDTRYGIGYTYNDIDGDSYYNYETPAVGSDFMQSPLIDAPGSTTKIMTWSQNKGYHIKTVHGKKELGLTAFVKYNNLNPFSTYGRPRSAQQAYNSMNGLIWSSGHPYLDPTNNYQPTTFVNSGDPVGETGWRDENPGDRGYLLSSGPFYIGVGDTVEIVGSIIIAAGTNWKKSIKKMKYFDNLAQSAYDSIFNYCSPPAPSVAVSQLDQKIVLSLEEGSAEIKNFACSNYEFQGINFYQGETETGPWHRIATHDIVDGVKAITDWTVDEYTGELLELLVQYGADSGIKHYIEITEDIIRGGPLVNYEKYYFTVTAYYYDEIAAQRVIESSLKALAVVPGVPGVGSVLNVDHRDVIEVKHSRGNADADFFPIIIDPYCLTSHTYELSFANVNESKVKWVLTDLNEDLVTKESSTLPVTENYFNIFTGNGPLEASEYSINNEITDGFIIVSEKATFIMPTSYHQAEIIVEIDSVTQIVFEGFHPNSADGTWYGFLKDRSDIPPDPLAGKPGLGNLFQDLELRFTGHGSIGIFFNRQLSIIDTILVPFELWTVEDSPRQINVAVYQIGSREKPLFERAPGTANGYQLKMNVNFIPVYEDYDETAVLARSYHWATDSDKMGWMLHFNKNKTPVKDKTVWEDGNVFRVTFINPIIPGEDVYTFTANGLITADKKTISDQMNAINIFPNPYIDQYSNGNPPDHKVYFTHLGIGTTIIRIYNLSGDMVAKIIKEIEFENVPGNQAEWNLRNQFGNPVANGMYLAHITVEDSNGKELGVRILKLGIF